MPDRGVLESIRRLYDAGLFLKAHAVAQLHGPLDQWRGTRAQILAGRLANHLGAGQLGRRLLLRAWRHDPTDWEARAFFGHVVVELRGPWAMWEWLERWGNPPADLTAARVDLLLLRAEVAGLLRDFETADRCFAEVAELNTERVWVAVRRVERLLREDRFEEALVLARSSLEVNPTHWALLGIAGQCLQVLGQDEEQLLLLRQGTLQTESSRLASMLYALEMELDLQGEALQTLERFEELTPLGEQELKHWLAAQRADCCYRLGRRAEAIVYARKAGDDEWFQGFIRRLESPPAEARRVELPVGFVRQHHVTCVPATLTALSRFWQKPADHLEVAEEICYDGTPGHSERNWAERHGWVVREFKVTLPAARALLDRGIPFALTTVRPESAHEQAVIGYDDFRESLVIRDPSVRNRVEAQAQALLAEQAASGPRGMAMVPAEHAALLAGITLPEADLYDLHHALLLSLDRHDRPSALAALQQLETVAPGHRLALQGRRALAHYDANLPDVLAAVEQLLSLFPDDVNLLLARLHSLRDLARHSEVMALLRQACAKAGSHPVLWQELAWELGHDARYEAEALRWLNRAQRSCPANAMALTTRAGILWSQRKRATAYELYRFAACQEDKKEGYATNWFRAAQWLKRVPEVMSFLRRRFEQHGHKSSSPACTLVWAYTELDQDAAANEVLVEALQLRPEDGLLKLFAAEHFAGQQQLDRAEALLMAAKTQAPFGAWARAAASVADRRGDRVLELDLWQQILAFEPLAMDAHRVVTFLLAEKEGRSAALHHLASACHCFPHYIPLLELRVQWTTDDGPAAVELVARELVTLNPGDAWARRELASALGTLGRFAEADEQLEAAAVRDPRSPALFDIWGENLARQGRLMEARARFSEAVRLAVDDTYAMRRLVECCTTPAEREEALTLIQDELVRQTTFGGGIVEFAQLARPFLTPEKLLGRLHEAHAARPDLWHYWLALAEALLAQGQHDAALVVAQEMTERFPLIPRVWFTLGSIHRARLEHEAEIGALEQARQLAPAWGLTAQALATAYEGAGRLEDARRVLETAVVRSAQDAQSRGGLADVLWKLGEKEAAVERIREAVLLDPGYDWAWDQLRHWSQELERPNAALELAEELTRRRPGEPRSWWLLGRMLEEPDRLAECLAALEKALALNPRFEAAWRRKAFALARASRYEEALAACSPEVFGDSPPVMLQVTAAWVFAQQAKLTEAIRRLHALLEKHPDLEMGWRWLADWHEERQEYAEAAQAANAIARLRPLDAVPLGYAGELKLRNDDRAGAEADFRRAFELDPDYTFAGFKLFELQLDRRDFDGARQTLQRLRGHVSTASLLERDLALAATAGDRGRVMELVQQLCTCPDDDRDAFSRAASRLTGPAFRRQAERIARASLRKPGVNPSAGWLWVTLRGARGNISNERQLLRLPVNSELARRAIARQLDELGAVQRDIRYHTLSARWFGGDGQLQRLLQAHAELLQRDSLLWGKVGHVHACRRRWHDVIDWLGDWRQRKHVRPWMLANLLVALQEVGRDADANQLIDEVRALPGDRREFMTFDLWHALRQACARQAEPGRQLVENLMEEQLSEFDRQLLCYLRVALDFADETLPPPPFDNKRCDQLRSAFRATRQERAGRIAFDEVVKLICRRLGRRWPAWWAQWQKWT